MITFTLKQFEEVKTKGEDLYKNIKEVYCPYFKEKIIFNSLGLEHLKFKKHGHARSQSDQYMRLKLIHMVPEVLGCSHTIQGIQDTNKFERVRVNSRTDTLLMPVTYYEFIAVVKRNRIKVILKQINNEQKFFWSIIPFWRMNANTMTRILHDGIPEED